MPLIKNCVLTFGVAYSYRVFSTTIDKMLVKNNLNTLVQNGNRILNSSEIRFVCFYHTHFKADDLLR